MKYVFDPEILREVAQSHLDQPLEKMLADIAQDLSERYPGLIETDLEWFFSHAGGAMGQLAILYALLREYVIFFGTPIGNQGHTGRYPFAEDYAILLDGEMWYFGEGEVQREEYRPGDVIYLPRGEAKGYRMVDRGWIIEYARGSIPTMLPFGVADTLFSTFDFKTLARTFRLYFKHLRRSSRRRRNAR